MEYFEMKPGELELHSVGTGEPLPVVFFFFLLLFLTGVTSTNAKINHENYKN